MRMRKCFSFPLLFFFICTLLTVVFSPVSAELAKASWTTKNTMNYERANLGVATVNEKIYAIGGDTGSIGGNVVPAIGKLGLCTDVTEEYDPVADMWTVKTSMPTSRALFGTAVCNGKIYCIGGYTTTVTGYDEYGGIQFISKDTDINEVYDPDQNNWITMAPLPEPMCGVSANTIKKQIFVTADESSTLYAYDTITDSWTLKTSAPFQNIGLSSAVIDNKIITIGMAANYSLYIQSYDVTTDTWNILSESKATATTKNRCATIQSQDSAKIYFFDEIFPSDVSAITNIFDVKYNIWSTGTAMPTNRVCAGTAVLDNTIYIIGGRIGLRGYITLINASNVTETYGYDPDSNFSTYIIPMFLTITIIIISILLISYKKAKKHTTLISKT